MATLSAMASLHLGLQMKRHRALISAFEESSIAHPSEYASLEWAIPTSWTDRNASFAPSIKHAVLAFLRGPPLRLANGSAETLAHYDAESLKSIIKHGALG